MKKQCVSHADEKPHNCRQFCLDLKKEIEIPGSKYTKEASDLIRAVWYVAKRLHRVLIASVASYTYMYVNTPKQRAARRHVLLVNY